MKRLGHFSRKNRLFILPAVLSAALLAAGCATQGYAGPERPESETAAIYFFSSKPLDLSDLAVDGKTQGVFDLGLRVLPGNHDAFAHFQIKDESCDSYGCNTKTINGKCTASVRAEAGRSYAIRVSSAADEAFVSVEDKETAELAGAGSCTTERTNSSYNPTLKKHY